MTMTVRNPKTGKITTTIDEFHGENANERMLSAVTSLVKWFKEYELIVLTVTTSVPDVASGD